MVSIAACLLIVLYVKHEVSYDTFFPNADRIYKMGLERKYPNHSTFFALVPHSYAAAIQRDFPEVENTLQLLGPNQDMIVNYKVNENETKTFEEDYFLFADSSFFSFFDINLIKGDKKTALALPNQVIVSRTTAQKYFGEVDPLGKVLSRNFGELKVTGVLENLPDNSHLRFDAVASFAGAEFRKAENFISFNSQTYLKLRPGTDAKGLEAKFPKMVDTYASGQIERELGQSWEDYKKAGNGYRYFLQPLTSIHLDPTNLEFTLTPSGNLKYIYVLSFIAVLILVIACINFMNLATVNNFHFQSLRDEITPLVIFSKEIFGPQSNSNYLAIRLKPNGFKEAIVKIGNKWKEFVPGRPFSYEFLEDNLNHDYAEEQRSGKLFRVFSGLAIIIACVGLFGLSAYTASLRTREIGIRKVMGATVGNMVMLLSKDFTKLVVIAFVLAAPLAWWMMDQWLSGFAYRVELGAGSFIIAGILALAIAWLTVSYQSIKAVIVNPVRSLKSE